jgi:preprotein translocase subunit SecD
MLALASSAGGALPVPVEVHRSTRSSGHAGQQAIDASARAAISASAATILFRHRRVPAGRRAGRRWR